MSVVTSIIIIFPYSENELKRIDEINSFKVGNINYQFKWIDSAEENGDFNYWGNKKFNSVVLLGSYNSFPIEEFFEHFQNNVKWEDPKYVQLLLNTERNNERTFRVYSNAGKILLVDSEKW